MTTLVLSRVRRTSGSSFWQCFDNFYILNPYGKSSSFSWWARELANTIYVESNEQAR